MIYITILTAMILPTTANHLNSTECVPMAVPIEIVNGTTEVKDWEPLVCKPTDSRGDYFVLANQVSQSKSGNCVYEYIPLVRSNNGNSYRTNGSKTFKMAQTHTNECPTLFSELYVTIEKIHAGDDKEEVFNGVMEVAEEIKRSESEEILSRTSLWDRLFDKSIREFLKITNENTQHREVAVEVIYGDYQSSGYLAVLQLNQEIWILTLSKHVDGFHIDEASRAIQ